VTHVVRGSDLLDNTPRQVLLQRRLGLPTPRYAHLPVIANAHGQKLSKQTFARALDGADAAASLRAALDFLDQPAPPPDRIAPAAILDWAVRHWSLATVPRATSLGGESLPASCRAFAG
jgi:glutamyl-Q tRNA(Asp) synthetase